MLSVIGLLSGPAASQQAVSSPVSPTLLRPTPINEAEAILEPFWEPVLSGLKNWVIRDGASHGLQVKQTWASVEFYWSSRPVQGPALSMTRKFGADCSDHDRLLVAVVLPEGGTLRVAADTDLGPREYVSPPAPKEIVEHALALDGARRIDSLTIEITPGAEGQATGWFKWIGLQNTAMLPRYLDRWDFSGKTWEGFLQDEDYTPRFQPMYGIFLPREDLAELRAKHRAALDETGQSPYLDRASALRALQPEKAIHEFANSGGRHNAQHGRVRDEAMTPFSGGLEAARVGLILEDKDLLRVAARYALSLVLCDKWDDGFLAQFPGSAWELRSFRRSYVSEDIAEILDLAGEMFTDAGRIYVMRRLTEEGIGPVNYITWRFDYLFQGNQLAFVTRGRLCAYLVMERFWPRVRPYTDIAYQNVREMFDTVILPDGGLLEPPTYVGATLGRGIEMLELFARARGEDLRAVLPDSLRKTGDYGAVIASTVPEADVIPYGDSGTLMRSGTLLSLAHLAPGSYWTTMLHKCLDREQRTAFSPEEKRMLDAIPKQGPAAPPFIVLRDTGHMASTRTLKGPEGSALPVKILILGNHGGEMHDHEHEDRGSFVLEFAGEAFAMDPGICEYEDPMAELMKQCQYHNMLAPAGLTERPAPARPILVDVKAAGKGNRKSFHARLDVSPGWGAHYKYWRRSWDSPAPETLTIRDEYELVKGDGVEFYWQTKLPCRIDGRQVTIQGARGSITLDAPEDCSLRIDTLPGPENTSQNRIAIRKPALSGVLEVRARLRAR
jgi:hypothetical protein